MPTLHDILAHRGLRDVMTLSRDTPYGKLDLVLPARAIPTPTDGAATQALLEQADQRFRHQDWDAGAALLVQAIAADPMQPAAYEMAMNVAEARGRFDEQVYNARQLLAAAPTFRNLGRLAIALGRAQDFDASMAISSHQWDHRREVSPREALAAVSVYLVSLHRHKDFAKMVAVATTALGEYGLDSTLLYQAALGMILLGDWEAAKPFLARVTELPADDALHGKLRELAGIVAQHDREQGR